MNYFFSSASTPNGDNQTLACNTTTLPSQPSSAAPVTSVPDLELVIEIESSFHGVLLGLPEECPGAVLNATAILHVRKKPLRASKLMATFDGRIKVQCNDGATFGPEQYRERVLAHKDWVLWEAGTNTHQTSSSSASRNHIPVGTHYYPLSIQLDGALPPSFSGKHGSIRYIISSTLFRPLFYSDISTVQEIEIKRCLVSEASAGSDITADMDQRSQPQDIGSLLMDRLSRVGLGPSANMMQPEAITTGPTTMAMTHHNTYKELLRYTATSPPIAYLEGGNIQIDLALEPLPPGSYIYSIAYGLKERIHYRSSATGNVADNKSETLYPIGQQTVIIPRDQERERSMSSAGAGASTRQLLELRACPLLINADTLTPLIEIQHRITCNVVVVLPDSLLQRRNTSSGSRNVNGTSRRDNQQDQGSNTGSVGGGGILRRLNIAPQPLAPSLNLVDSTGAEVANNAVLLGEPTLSIIEPALTPATIELNDAPPPPPPSRVENIVLEFPIILTSCYPSAPRDRSYNPQNVPVAASHQEPILNNVDGAENDNVSVPLLASSCHGGSEQALVAQFVHNQAVVPTVILTTGTTIQPTSAAGPSTVPMSSSYSSPSSSIFASATSTNDHSVASSSSSNSSPLIPQSDQAILGVRPELPQVLPQSGIGAGLRAAAAASATVAATTATTSESHSLLVSQSEARPGISRPPSYGRADVVAVVEEPPKYEDVVDAQEMMPRSGLGITIPQAVPIPMNIANPSRAVLHWEPYHGVSICCQPDLAT
ncbi:Arrestin domain-containing protein 2 [Podila epigama]|nr:Arrestin domain-containing protein 2 [Podila epigama]